MTPRQKTRVSIHKWMNLINNKIKISPVSTLIISIWSVVQAAQTKMDLKACTPTNKDR